MNKLMPGLFEGLAGDPDKIPLSEDDAINQTTASRRAQTSSTIRGGASELVPFVCTGFREG
jgi:hypothetical protein